MKTISLIVKKSVILIVIFISMSPFLFADERDENIEMFILLDKSKSMEEEIDEVKLYVRDFLVETFLIPGDTIQIIGFYGGTELIYYGEIKDTTLSKLSRSISFIEANGRFTDIGNALDYLNNTVDNLPASMAQRYLLLITDGKQEAPPESPYYTPDGSFNHRLLANAKTIQRRGWKIHILGIGEGTIASTIAEELAASYSEVSGEITAEKINAALTSLMGRVDLGVGNTKINFDNNTIELELQLESVEWDQDINIVIEDIKAQSNTSGITSILTEPISLTLTPNQKSKTNVILNLPNFFDPEGSSIDVTLDFVISEPYALTPNSVEINLSPKSSFNIIPILIGLIAIVIIIIIVLLLKSRKGSEEAIITEKVLSCVIDGASKFNKDIKMSFGDHFFLKRDTFGITIVKGTVENPLAKIVWKSDGAFIEMLSEEDFKAISSLKGDILGRLLSFRVKDNQRLTLRISNKDG